MKTGSIIVIWLTILLGTSQAAAQDVEVGKSLYKKNCRACHGPTAKGLASYPKLVGHPAEYLVDRLERYRAGEKFGPNTPLMAPRAKKLSDEDISNIVTFIVTTFE
ncbi:MAG: cytochrome c [Roseibium album]|uniref:Cytochrome c-554(548) n=1 Tax=Roseibium album TaxID=311410 RepID=A0A0M7B0B3_9HYPH|nr:cytochrome c [Roseibium album]MBG6143894.1 cytochrome c553 [Labrenzia sp. EL_142]MBG6156045.1 cytochrome c553 [Labrenzia sp. EL_162]MBG6163838.1 cytochrome c553 [Labrenzia sp. EL_195]MBG6194578.1 cytochrome c553 [Labrenzia sp. EL_159]MBG6211815.1 cytochrome c553 [Labrenzia sp. EL_126]MCR9057302.1 cytochrome c [Paracoccaceae bacterium]